MLEVKNLLKARVEVNMPQKNQDYPFPDHDLGHVSSGRSLSSTRMEVEEGNGLYTHLSRVLEGEIKVQSLQIEYRQPKLQISPPIGNNDKCTWQNSS